MKPAPSALPDFLNELRPRISGDLRTDDYNKVLYSTDSSIFQVMPFGVLMPKTMEDVHAAVELAAKYRIPLLPRTGGSSLAGQAVNAALVVDFTKHLDDILEINPEEQWVRVQPGRVLDELNIELAPHGLQFGPDPASGQRAAMAGIVSNNSTGAHSILYGMTVEHVLEIKGFLSDGSPFHFRSMDDGMFAQMQQRSGLEGQIYREIGDIITNHKSTIQTATPRHWRRTGGYGLDRLVDGVSHRWTRDPEINLAKLLSGAEGSLAVISEIKLNLVPKPKMTALVLVQFPNLQLALSSVPTMLTADPSAIELLDNLALTLCKNVPEYARLLKTFAHGDPNCILITEFYGDNESELRSKIARLEEILRQNKIDCVNVPAYDPRMQNSVWTVRKVGLGLLMSIKGDQKPLPFIEDAAVPPEHLAEYIGRLERFSADIGTKVAYYAHASAGCLHVRPVIDAKVATDIEKLPKIATFSAELVGHYGGCISSEHGDGRTRSWLLEKFYGEEMFNLFRRVKNVFDPHNLFNPGNIVDQDFITENLRFGADYRVPEIKTHIDFTPDQGFERAVELCNGAGVCRKRTVGTMCPSFMVTREEEHSTRGRANALRAAMSGKLPAGELTSKRMYEVMELCISCKACKAECPSSVDMAKIKFEFLAQYYDANGTPLRAKLFGNIPKINRLMTHLPGFVRSFINWKMGLAPVRWFNEKLFGVSIHRELPAFAPESFVEWHRKNRKPASIDPAKKQVLLFNDTFNTYNDPHVSIAALEVLEAAGYEVLLPGNVCCGRPAMSKGLVDLARESARNTIDKLLPFAEAGIAIVGLEPSCLLSMRDEHFSLLPGDERVKTVAAQCVTFEEFVADLVEKGELKLKFSGNGSLKKALLHGHCHQKSLIGTKPSHQTLNAAGFAVEEVDSGCCGMAGSFGYEAEHYDVSQQMAERRLMPAIREQDDDTVIVAAGTSCRHQIAHFAGKTALHPAEAVRNMIAD